MMIGRIARRLCESPSCHWADRGAERPLYLVRTGAALVALCAECKARREGLLRAVLRHRMRRADELGLMVQPAGLRQVT